MWDSPAWSGETTECYCSESERACSTLAMSSPCRSPATGCDWAKTRMNPCRSADLRLPSLLWLAACWERSDVICYKPPETTNERIILFYYIINITPPVCITTNRNTHQSSFPRCIFKNVKRNVKISEVWLHVMIIFSISIYVLIIQLID